MQPDVIAGGRYRVESAIGQGGMGTVWLCRDERLHRVVAVKQVGLLPGESVTDSARAFREARSSAGVSHPNVVTVFDVVEDSGHIWLVMEYVPGRSLSQIIKQDGPLDPATVADIGAQVADGLTGLHAAGTMHRDVKPGNVLIREDGVAKISDFGIARTAGDQTLTGGGYVTGTPSYFSPALARGEAPGPEDDVWALGATLYAAVEGHSPYQKRSNPVAVLHDITSGPPTPPQRAGFLEPALQRMMDRDPSSRWSMEDAGHVLRRLADEHRSDATLRQTRESALEKIPEEPPAPAASPRSDPLPTPAPAPAPVVQRPRRRRRVLPLLVAAVALLVLAAGAWMFAQLRDETPSGASGKGTSSAPQEDSGQGSSQSGGSSAQKGSSSAAHAKEAFVRHYYSQAPGGTDAGWAMLGPSLKQQGRGSYDGFWKTIDSVEVTSATASESGNTVDVTLTYHTTDGRVSTEHKREHLVRSSSGGYLLDTDEPAG